jgi:hypothetical protein
VDGAWLCPACAVRGDHLACDWWRGCECSVRRGEEYGSLVLCESLTDRLPREGR